MHFIDVHPFTTFHDSKIHHLCGFIDFTMSFIDMAVLCMYEVIIHFCFHLLAPGFSFCTGGEYGAFQTDVHIFIVYEK